MATGVTGNPDQSIFNKDTTNTQETLSKSLGDRFQKFISVEKFLAFRQVKAIDIGLDPSKKILRGAQPDALQGDNAVAGISKERPFIAIRIQLLDKEQKQAAETVEVIHKKYFDDPNLNIWISTIHTMTERGVVFYASGTPCRTNISRLLEMFSKEKRYNIPFQANILFASLQKKFEVE